MTLIYSQTIIINAIPSIVWKHLSDLELMKQWMAEPEMKLEIQTDWNVGNPIIIKGFHHAPFENKGIVLEFEPHKLLSYTHVSSLSRLSDVPEHYTTITFWLKELENKTELTLELENFADEIIYKHLVFYWGNTLGILKEKVEYCNL